jgi:hypothetical protein
MADGQVRRTIRRKRTIEGVSSQPTRSTDRSVARQSGSVATDDRNAVTDDRNTDNEPVAVERDGVDIISVDPSELGEFIARDTAERSAGTGTGSDSSGDRTGKRRTYTRRTSRKETVQDIAPVLDMVHTLAAAILHAPEMLLDTEETKQVSDAYTTFCKHHEVPAVTAKRMSEVVLIGVALKVYGTRFVAIRNRKKMENAERAANVTEMPQRANVAHGVQ